MQIDATRQVTNRRPDQTPPDESRQDVVKQDSQGPVEPGRALALTATQPQVARALTYRPAPFLAHLIATRERAPQTRERRRAEPGEASAAYRAMAALTDV